MKKKERVVDFIAEAEKIVNDYIASSSLSSSFSSSSFTSKQSISPSFAPKQSMLISKGKSKTKSVKGRFWDFILNMVMAIGCLMITAILVWGLFG